MKGALTLPVELTPVSIELPPSSNREGCGVSSLAPQWIIEKFRYNITRYFITRGANLTLESYFQGEDPWPRMTTGNDPYHANHMEIVMRNRANDYLLSCTLTDESLADPENKWFPCINAERFVSPAIETYIKLNLTDIQLRITINQTWYCSGNEQDEL